MEKIKDKVKKFMIEAFDFGDELDNIENIHLFEEGIVDSFGTIKIFEFIKDNFNIIITKKDIMLYPMNTIYDIANIIDIKLKERK